MKSFYASLLLSIVLTFSQGLMADNFEAQFYFNIYDKYRAVPENLMLMKHEHVMQQLKIIETANNKITIEKVGESVEHRSINLVSFGKGQLKILLWSQMHGNEPTATAALLAIFKYFADNSETSFVQKLYNKLSINALIMLNPDGAERFQRRNTLDIDINRDARMQQTPEGRILKKIQEKIQPDFGFNLHNMGGRETIEGTDKILKIALMAPPFNKENEDNLTRIKAKKLAILIKNTLDKFIKGHIAKYKADYMPRAFGDAMQNWGVSTVLLETGSYTDDEHYFLEKLNFIALLSSFNAMANGTIKNVDSKEYDNIPLEGRKMFDILIRNVLIVNGYQNAPFYGDVGINIDYRLHNGKIDTIGTIKDIGDLSIYYGKKIVQNDNLIITPGFILSAYSKGKYSNQLLRKGIITIVTDNDNSENKSLDNNIELDSKILIPDIPELTSIPGNRYKIKNKGIIKRNAAADILIFSQSEKDTLYLDSLKYVIKNGYTFGFND